MENNITLGEWLILIDQLEVVKLISGEYYIQKDHKKISPESNVAAGPFSAGSAFKKIYYDKGGLKSFLSLISGSYKELYYKKFLEAPYEDVPLYIGDLDRMIPTERVTFKIILNWRLKIGK